MVTGSILLSMSLIAMLWLTGVSDLWWTTTTQGEVRTRSQQTVNRIVSELRSATRATQTAPPNATIPAPPANTSVTFFLPADLDLNGLIIDAAGNTEWDVAFPVQYVFVPAQQQLLRIQGGQQTVMANDVTAAAFDDRGTLATLSNNEIRVSLTVQRTTPQRRTVSATSVEIVKLRN
ncbi:MAG: hypothetical protein A3C53_02305 [Omnitrophica WOR_2 bacterium RIFCSPHIGHO2_02_FULL_68_15]|nr:MAG: hypothetical protein A3C53_02305 [Omnitrophica WOR_2 bacterium RIFCSPHIGHO2_02_FULL_68_15]